MAGDPEIDREEVEIEEECLLKEISQSFAVPDAEFLLLDNWVKRLVSLETEALNLIEG